MTKIIDPANQSQAGHDCGLHVISYETRCDAEGIPTDAAFTAARDPTAALQAHMTPMTGSTTTVYEPRSAAVGRLLEPWGDLSDAVRRRHRDLAIPMTLQGIPRSPQAQALTAALLDAVILPYKLRSAKRGQVGPSSTGKLKTALGAVVADLFASANSGRWSARSTKRSSFTGKGIGEAAFADVWKSLHHEGFLVHVKGHTLKRELTGAQHFSPIFRPTLALLQVAQDHGVDIHAVGVHFTFQPSSPTATG